MKAFFLCLFFLFVATAATSVRAQTGPAGHTYGGDRPAVEGEAGNAPTKITGVLDKIEKFRNGLRITIKAGDNKEYQYSVFYAGQGPQTSLSVDKNVKDVTLKTVDDLKVADTVYIKIDAGNIKSLVLKQRPAETAQNKP
jgi:hypothetical protein